MKDHMGLIVIMACFAFTLAFTQATQAIVFQEGDVIVGIANGQYDVYDEFGTYKGTLDDGMGGFTTGCAANGDRTLLYTTNFSNTKVVVYDVAEPNNIAQIIDTGAINPDGHSESVVFDAAGNFYVGHPDGDADIQMYDSSGTYVKSFDVAVESRGSDWMDLSSNQQTMFYTSEHYGIKRYDIVADMQLPDFATLPNRPAYALRLLPPFDGSGGLLVAVTSDIKRLDGGGAVMQTYDAAGENQWFSMNIAPDGTSFWAGSFDTDNFYKFDIDSGAILVGPINAGPGGTLFGICVFGEIVGGQTVEVDMDIKPGSCPNSFNPSNKGVLPVALLGTEDFDVTQIDLATVMLSRADEVGGSVAPHEGPPGPHSTYEDVATPFDGELCDCHELYGDGFMDLSLKFISPEVTQALELDTLMMNDEIELVVSGLLLDGREFEAHDCIRIVGQRSIFGAKSASISK